MADLRTAADDLEVAVRTAAENYQLSFEKAVADYLAAQQNGMNAYELELAAAYQKYAAALRGAME